MLLDAVRRVDKRFAEAEVGALVVLIRVGVAVGLDATRRRWNRDPGTRVPGYVVPGYTGPQAGFLFALRANRIEYALVRAKRGLGIASGRFPGTPGSQYFAAYIQTQTRDYYSGLPSVWGRKKESGDKKVSEDLAKSCLDNVPRLMHDQAPRFWEVRLLALTAN
eukprot:196445-Rhodomonas_salina.6